MINPYATSFMIATRQDYHVRPRLTAARDPKPSKSSFRLFWLKDAAKARES